MSDYTSHEQIMAGFDHHTEMREECATIARACTRALSEGHTAEATRLAEQFVTLDASRFEFLMELSHATQALCTVES